MHTWNKVLYIRHVSCLSYDRIGLVTFHPLLLAPHFSLEFGGAYSRLPPQNKLQTKSLSARGVHGLSWVRLSHV